MLQGYYSLNYSYSPLDGSVVLRVLKSSSFRYSELSCVCVCVGYWLLTPVCYSPSKPAVPKHPLCALQNATFWGKKMKTRCSLILKNLKVLTVKYRFQIIKHAIGGSFYFHYSKIQIT